MPYVGLKPTGYRPSLDRSHPHAQNMVAFWVFEMGGGLSVVDLVSDRIGTLTNGPTWVNNRSGNGGYGVNFTSASSQYIDAGNPLALDFAASGSMGVCASYYHPTKPNFTNFMLVNKGSQFALDVEGPSNSGRFYINNGGSGALWAEGRTAVDGDCRVIGGSWNIANTTGYIAAEGRLVTSSSAPFASIPSSTSNVRIASTSAGGSYLNGHVNFVAIWGKAVPPDLMCDFQRNPFASVLTRRPFYFILPGSSAAPATTISGSSAISIGSSGTVTLAAPAVTIGGSSAISIGSAGTVTLVGPPVTIGGSSAIEIGSSGTVTLAAPAVTIGGSSAISIGSSGTVTLAGPAGTVIGGESAITIGSSGTITLTVPAVTIGGSSAISIGSSGTVTLAGPAGTVIGGSSAISIGSSGTITLVGPPVTIGGSSAISIGSSGTITLTGTVTNTEISGSSAISIGCSGTITLTGTTYGPDTDIFQDIQDRLIATNAFAPDGVDFGAPSEVLQRSARQYPCAAIQQTRFVEPSRFDYGDKVRTVFYTITLVTREEEPRRRFQTLSVLSAKVQNALDGQSLADKTFPVLTQINTGTFQPTPNHPEQRLILNGTFTYEVLGYDARDESEPTY